MSGITFGFGAFFGFIGAIIFISIICAILYFVGVVSWLPYYLLIGESDTEEMQEGYRYLLGFIILIILCNNSYTYPYIELLCEFLNPNK